MSNQLYCIRQISVYTFTSVINLTINHISQKTVQGHGNTNNVEQVINSKTVAFIHGHWNVSHQYSICIVYI